MKLSLSSFFHLSVIASVSATSAMAAHWDGANNPEFFNRPYNPTHYNYKLNELPTSGTVNEENTPWADSYWPKQRGSFSYRWRAFQSENENQTYTTKERENKFFSYKFYTKDELKRMSADQIAMLSPMEKYSIYTGDYSYKLAKRYLNGKGNGPERVSWEGYCHAWAPAATHFAEPAPTLRVNKDGIPVSFGSGDVKALLVANYHEIMFPGYLSFKDRSKKSYINGAGCATNVTFLYPTTRMKNGVEEMAEYGDTDGLLDSELEKNVSDFQAGLRRVIETNPNSPTILTVSNAKELAYDTQLPAKARKAAQTPGCMGVNAGTFHIIVANQLGIMKKGFELDKTRDGQIWNQPARGFTSRIVGYENPGMDSPPGTAKIANVETDLQYADDTDYGWTFWFPTLTNLFHPEENFMKEYNLYMRMLMSVGDETEMQQYPTSIMDTAHYKYKLELDEAGKIIGGQWITLDRPDTLWIMEPHGFEGNFEKLGEIYTPAKI